MTANKIVRCAVYTRKSTETNLDLEFNSLHAQRESCESYIKSQFHEGWRVISTRYDDGGISGATLDRPDLQRLLDDVRARQVDLIVVYKVDRLTRSLKDFVKLVELFDAHGVSFVSVTQAFNTRDSVGRLTLNMLLSFAQFEREVIAERVRDKIAASKARGYWMGGGVPIGYRIQDKKLVIDEAEAETVRFIFRRYLELGTVDGVALELRARQLRTKRFERAGRVRGGIPFRRPSLVYILKNRTYIGEIVHREKVYAGNHSPILERVLFERANQLLKTNTICHNTRPPNPKASLLAGILFDSAGNCMTPARTNRKDKCHHYYVSMGLANHFDSSELGAVTRVSAPSIEEAVLGFLHRQVRVTEDVANVLRSIVRRIVIRSDALEIYLRHSEGEPGTEIECGPTIIPWQKKPTRLEAGIVFVPAATSAEQNHLARQSLLAGVAKARIWMSELADGGSIADIAREDGRTDRQIRSLLNLAFLSPGQVKGLLDGLGPIGTITNIAKSPPILWPEAANLAAVCPDLT